jgi:hypothetical protein
MQAAYLCLTQLLDYQHELVLLLVNNPPCPSPLPPPPPSTQLVL